MIARLRRFLFGSIRGQLILGIALVHAVLMTLFVVDLVLKQRQFLHQQTLERAYSLSRSTASASVQWVLADDLVGMEELVHSLAGYPDLRYAMIVAPSGRVLAHSQAGIAGRYLADPVSRKLLAAEPRLALLVDSASVVDVAAPITRGPDLIGWARIGLGQDRQAASLRAVGREGLAYTLGAIAVGTLFALFMARRLTRPLYRLRSVADAVRQGRHDLRAQLPAGDEIGHLADGFDRMVDELVDNEQRLRLSQEELRASRRMLDSIVENIPHMIFVKRAGDLRYALVNKAAEELFGYPREEVLGKTDRDLFPAEQAAFFTGKDREVLAGHDLLDIQEEPLASRTLGARVLHTKKLGLRDDAGVPAYLLGISEDITERKRIETELARHREHLETLVAERTAALAESELRYRTVADFTSDWEEWLAEDGRFRYVSPSCQQITGYPPGDFLTDAGLMQRILVPEDRDRVGAHFRALDEVQAPTTLEFRIRRQDGTVVWIEHVCKPVHDDRGHYLGRRGSNRDITEHKRLAADLALARDQAESANRAKSQFLANMSHELRTPLNAILGFAQLLARDRGLTADQRRSLDAISRSGQHLLGLINDVLEISRIEAGRTAVQSAPFDLDDSLRAIEEMIRVRADAKGLTFSLERIGPIPRYVEGDAPRLRQILLNLLANAVKYTDRGGARLRVAAAAPGRLRFEVVDSGPGIPAEEQERIFQPFYQTALGAAKAEGSGLGLAISREYVRLLGGELCLLSQPAQGTTFHFELPLPEMAGIPADASLPRRVVRLRPGQAAPDVLVVEDNEDNRELLSRLLSQVGFRPRTADNGAEAVARCRERRPDFIWMDMRMPVMDGYEATRRIRALPGSGSIRIVALTASAFQENRDDILAAGCDDMVAKPLDERQLFDAMARLLGIAFEYEVDPREAAPAAGATVLPALPADLAGDLRRAAEALDIEATRAVVERIAAVSPDAAATLRRLLDDFRFDEMLVLLDAAHGTPG